MAHTDAEFLKKLLATFHVEAQEHIRAISSGLIALEKAAAVPEKQKEILEAIFREAHSLKGAARAVNAHEMETVCRSLENHFSALRKEEVVPSPALFDLLHEAVNALGKLLPSGDPERAAAGEPQASEVGGQMETARAGAPARPSVPESRQEPAGVELIPVSTKTVRISTAKLDMLLRQAEELLSLKQIGRQHAAELRGVCSTLDLASKERAKTRPDVRTLQESLEALGKRNGLADQAENPKKRDASLRNVLEFLERNANAVKPLQDRLATLAKSAEQDHRAVSSMVDGLLEDMKKALMLPFSSLLELFPKFVRDLSRDRGKEVDLVVRGGEIEADRRILEEMKDPLLHLLRNCIDHGIEAPQKREGRKKPPGGTVTIAIAQRNGSQVEILVSDDGAGIDPAKVRAAAVKLGVVSQEEVEKLDEPQALSLVFQSGVSTSPIITDISGRGLGLAIVREKVEKLGGTVSMETQREVRTVFRIVLPLTLAAFRGLLVRVSEHLFVLPTTYVERVVRVSQEEIKTVENRETIPLNGRAISLVRLGDALELPFRKERNGSARHLSVVVLSAAEKRIAFLVDEISDEQEVLVKSFGPQLSRVRNVAGATVLGTGQAVPILNVPDLMKSAVRRGTAPLRPAAATEEAPAERKTILVAEDSITARTLLKNILESAGFKVTTAVDGVDAFTTLRTESFDLVVSDVDMPRMSGFDLTTKIRGDNQLAGLPVVLVTALESREDRERGIDAGANAYLVKSSFDQSNLLEVIRRLI